MNLRNFEECADPKALESGHACFLGSAMKPVRYEGGQWISALKEDEDCEVRVNLTEKDDILSSACSCQDGGKLCSHQVAVMYELRKVDRARAQRLPDLAAKLVELDKHELVSLLLRCAESDKEVMAELMMIKAGEREALAMAREMVKASIEKRSERGYVKYSEVESAVKGAEKVLDNLRGSGYSISAKIKIAEIVIEEMMALLGDADDSSGHICTMVEQAVEILAAMPEEPGFDDFGSIFSIAVNSVFDGWSEWRFALLESLIPMCHRKDLRERLEGCLNQISGKKKSSKYDKEKAEQMMHDLILAFDGESAAWSYICMHLSNSEFREMAIEATLEKNDAQAALELCLAGELEDSELSGLVEKWKKLRYRACGILGDTQSQKKIALEFARDSDHFYFTELKRLTAPEEWAKTLNKFLDDHGAKLRQSVLEKILVQEGLTARLMAFCKKHPEKVTTHHRLLVPEFEEEACALFEDQIKVEALKASNRTQYASVCNLVEEFAKTFGKQRGEKILHSLLSVYSKRAAFKEELKQISLL
ncbi:MAG: SWIM zinc finger family protein [Clostridiales bacterium]|jgi:hypothetical protein|nr:SWIM zinc finger family protein [Clostridiales bacterium]